MKKLVALIGFVLMGILASCDKNESSPEDLYGKWKATEYLADPGDGSGTWQKVKGAPKYFKLDKDGTVSGEIFSGFTKFKVLDTNRIEFTGDKDKSPLIFHYYFLGRTLQFTPLQPMCIEPCGRRYIKSN